MANKLKHKYISHEGISAVLWIMDNVVFVDNKGKRLFERKFESDEEAKKYFDEYEEIPAPQEQPV